MEVHLYVLVIEKEKEGPRSHLTGTLPQSGNVVLSYTLYDM